MATVKWEGLDEWQKSEEGWSKKVTQNIVAEIEKTAFRIERDAKLTVPVDSGDLRKSINTDVKTKSTGVTAEIGTDIEYSEFVEFGTINQRAQPYLIPSFDKNVANLENAINNILRGD